MNAYIRFKLALTEDEPTIKPYMEDRWAELADVQATPRKSRSRCSTTCTTAGRCCCAIPKPTGNAPSAIRKWEWSRWRKISLSMPGTDGIT